MDLLLYLALIPALGVTAQWLAWRTNLPGILLLLLFGVVLGWFVNLDAFIGELTTGGEKAGPELLFPIVSLSVAIIMFEGGLSLRFHELRESGSAALRLCTIGALVTWFGATLAAHFTLGFQWQLSFLLGAILVVTGPTVIGPLLRQVRPTRRVASTLKWEGIVIDPIGAVLAVLVFEHALLHSGEASVGSALLMLAKTSSVGVVLGIVGGAVLSVNLRRYWIPDNLQGVFVLACTLLLFAISNHLAHESGLITVTVLGIWLTNQRDIDIEHIIELKENLRTLLIGCLFIVLGSRVNIADIAAVGWPGLVFLSLLIVVVRPLSVFISLLGSPLSIPERSFIAMLAPRGIVAAAVSSVFALELQRRAGEIHMPLSEQLATVTFLVIIGTVFVYGMAATPIARWLGLADTNTNGILIVGADDWVQDFSLELQRAGLSVLLVDTNFGKVTKAKVAGLNALCVSILNEHARDELPLTGIGQLFAMTPNDEINSLAIRECKQMFDSSRLYQLSFHSANTHNRRGMTQNLRGRTLFGADLTFSQFEQMHEAGAAFKATKLSEEFSYDTFRQTYGNDPVLLCVINEDETLSVNAVDTPVTPAAGQTVIAMVSGVPVPVDHAARPPQA